MNTAGQADCAGHGAADYFGFLVGLEAAQRINSAAEVYRRAENAGRLGSKRTRLAADYQWGQAAVEALMRWRSHDPAVNT